MRTVQHPPPAPTSGGGIRKSARVASGSEYATDIHPVPAPRSGVEIRNTATPGAGVAVFPKHHPIPAPGKGCATVSQAIPGPGKPCNYCGRACARVVAACAAVWRASPGLENDGEGNEKRWESREEREKRGLPPRRQARKEIQARLLPRAMRESCSPNRTGTLRSLGWLTRCNRLLSPYLDLACQSRLPSSDFFLAGLALLREGFSRLFLAPPWPNHLQARPKCFVSKPTN